jgi:tetratricopeptide (TPR) repeat protein
MDFLPLSGFLKSESAESDADFFVPNGITTEMVNSNPEETDRRFRQYLEECVSRNQVNKVWVYYILCTWYYAEGKFEKVITLSLRASAEHPSDPRAYYLLGSIYYGVFMNSTEGPKNSNEALLARPDFGNFPIEIQKQVRENLEFEKKNQQLVNAIREFNPALTPDEAAKLALQYFGSILKCNISSKDRQMVQTHVTNITQAQLNLLYK